MKASELRQMKNEELMNLLNDLMKKKRETRFNMEYGQIEDLSQLRKIRKDIARIKTILTERNIKV